MKIFRIRKYEKISDIIATQIIYFEINLIGRIYMKKTFTIDICKRRLKEMETMCTIFKFKDLIVGRCS